MKISLSLPQVGYQNVSQKNSKCFKAKLLKTGVTPCKIGSDAKNIVKNNDITKTVPLATSAAVVGIESITLNDTNELLKTRLYELEKLPNQIRFNFYADLKYFGVENMKPFKKEGGDSKTGKPIVGHDYEEHFTAKNGCTVVAGIKYASVPQGVDNKDYTHRYVEVLDPKARGFTCEHGVLGFLTENGVPAMRRTEKILYDYKPETEERVYMETADSLHGMMNFAKKDTKSLPNKQEERKEIMNSAIEQLSSFRYKNPTIRSTFDIDDCVESLLEEYF